MMKEHRGSRRRWFMVVIGLVAVATPIRFQYRTWMNKAGKRRIDQQESPSLGFHHHPPTNRSSFGELYHHHEDPRTLDETANGSINATAVTTSPTGDLSNQTDDEIDGLAFRSETNISMTAGKKDERNPEVSKDTAINESERSQTSNDNASNESSTLIQDFDLLNQNSKGDVHDDSNGGAVRPVVNASNTVGREERNPATEYNSTNESSTPVLSSINITDLSLYAANKSSVDYYACCGAGHRLLRTANAYHLAREINFGLRVYWGWCDKIEVYHHLFGPEPIQDLTNVTSLNQIIAARNEVGGFDSSHGRGPDGRCQCTEAKIQNDIKFYSSLRYRFSQRQQVDDFVRQHFDNASLVLGMHIRAGNNETGDFTLKGRGINNMTEWLDHVVEHIKSLLHYQHSDFNASQHPPVLFVASDTPSMVPRLQSMFLADSLQIIAFPHALTAKEGTGVSFGEHGEGQECVLAWEAIFLDMMILSHVDILVSPRYSSFSQSIPVSLVYAQRQKKTTTTTKASSVGQNSTFPPAACFLDYDAVRMKCYDTFLEWCCDTEVLQNIVLMFPNELLFSNRTWMQIEPRSPQCDLDWPHYTCLPFRVERAQELDTSTNISRIQASLAS